MPVRLEEEMKFSLALALETILDFFLCLFCAIILFRNRYNTSPFISNFCRTTNLKITRNVNNVTRHCSNFQLVSQHFSFLERTLHLLWGFFSVCVNRITLFLENMHSMSFQRKGLTLLVPNSRYLHDSFFYSDTKGFTLTRCFCQRSKLIFNF